MTRVDTAYKLLQRNPPFQMAHLLHEIGDQPEILPHYAVVGHHVVQQSPWAELSREIIVQAARDALMQIRGGCANIYSPSAKESAVAYFREREYLVHATMAGIDSATMEGLRERVLGGENFLPIAVDSQ